MINAGKLNQQIILQINNLTQDSELNQISNWINWRTVWAEPLKETSKEFYRLASNNSEIIKVFRIRYIHGVNANQRIKFKNKYFEIIGEPINEGEKNIELILTCKGVD